MFRYLERDVREFEFADPSVELHRYPHVGWE